MNELSKKIISLPKLLQKAQNVFNRFIRKRDENLGCISCGGPVQQAGHYYSAGKVSALRFNEVNVNGQCIKCNYFEHSNAINYRFGLIKRYGKTKLEQLEATISIRKVKKWSRFELEQIIKMYAA